MKIQKKKFFLGGGGGGWGGRVRGGSVWCGGGQDGCEPRIKVFVKIKKKFGGGGGSGGGGGGGGSGGGSGWWGGWARVDVNAMLG